VGARVAGRWAMGGAEDDREQDDDGLAEMADFLGGLDAAGGEDEPDAAAVAAAAAVEEERSQVRKNGTF
jgi:hypothetical protein